MKGFAGENFYKPASRADYLVKLIKTKNTANKNTVPALAFA